MLIDKIVVENFGPYYSQHELKLASDPTSPVTLIHGENMRGKTTILNAIRWCLYGELIESDRAGTELHELLNYDAADEGEYFFRVKLVFEHDDYDYELERHVQAPSKPEDDSHLKSTVYLKRGGHILPTEQIDDAINDILHRDVSRFFLFDGEMLQQYEALVHNPDVKADLVKKSIERILGLPALRLAVEDIDQLRKKAAKRQRKAVKKREASRELLAETEALEERVDAKEENLSDLREQEDELEARRQRLRDKRKQHSAVREEAQRLETLEDQISNREEERSEIVEECQALLSEGWWQPVVPVVRSLIGRLEEKAETATSLEQKQAVGEAIVSRLQETLEGGQCSTCGQGIEEVESEIREELSDLQEELDALREGEGTGYTRAEIAARLRRLKEYDAYREMLRFEEKERRKQELEIEIRSKEREVQDIKDALKDYDLPQIREIESDLEDVVGELRLIEDEIEEEREELQELEAELASKQDEIDRLPDADRDIAAEASVYSILLESFSGAIDQFRERLRKEVEDEASSIFTKLTTEPGFEGLSINNRYGLDIVFDRDRIMKRRSKGAEQVVALSLIAALNNCAVREGPVVMDTPFGRLDEGHRENIIDFLPNLGRQVVVLVQSGEWGGESDTELLGERLGREYRIERDGKPTRSRLKQV